VLKTLEFGLIMGGQPVPADVVFKPPPPEPGLVPTNPPTHPPTRPIDARVLMLK
jgi:hypothetical protein